ncbi:glutathione S-transferase family protein [Myxococcota bacterium]|nr:glutathione S-transferase family protein [Myxococcota bacterium]
MPQLALTYFDSPGRAEPVRLALRMGGLPFEDRRLSFPEFASARARGDFPLGSVPVLEIDGQRITQTAAMLRWAARVGDTSLYPQDPTLALWVDSALDSMNDTFSHALLPSLFERDPERKLAMRAELVAGPMARVFTYIEGLVARSGGPFVAGAALSVADLVIALQVDQVRRGGLDGITLEHLAPYPRLVALAEACLADPRVVAARAG